MGMDIKDRVDLPGLINSHLDQIDRSREELGKFKEMLQSIFDSDSTFQAHVAAVKEAQKVKSATKNQILKLPHAADLTAKIVDAKAHIKDLQDTLSSYLSDYAKTGATTLETTDGQVRQIVFTAKLVKVGK